MGFTIVDTIMYHTYAGSLDTLELLLTLSERKIVSAIVDNGGQHDDRAASLNIVLVHPWETCYRHSS